MSPMNWLEILGWDKNKVDDLRYVAFSYIKQGGYDIALSFFDAIVILTPPNAYDLQTIGALHLQLGNSLKALDYLDRALTIEPNHLPTQLNRAKVLFMLGYKKQGIQQAQELTNCPDPDIAAAASALILGYS